MKTIPFLNEIIALRRDFHAHPELAFEETRTAGIVARELSSYGLDVHTGLAKTGVVGVLKKGNSARAIGLRADIDALPLSEQSDLPYGSRHPGRHHACGHDGHIAMLLGAARFLALDPGAADFDGSVYFIFQPAEEGEGGANAMIREGLFRRFPMDAVFGLHNWPELPAGQIAVLTGPVMAGDCHLKIVVRGRSGHAALPHQNVDTLLAASHLVVALQTVVARNLPPWESAVVSVTQMHGGGAMNIIPDEAILRGTLRAFSQDVKTVLETAIRRICEGIGQTFGAAVSVDFDHRYPPTVNSAAEAALCARAAASVFSADRVRQNERPSTGAEDFAYMLLEKPGCYAWLGSGVPGKPAQALHNARFDFNDDIVESGIRYWAALVRHALGCL